MSLHRRVARRDDNEPAIRARFAFHGWYTGSRRAPSQSAPPSAPPGLSQVDLELDDILREASQEAAAIIKAGGARPRQRGPKPSSDGSLMSHVPSTDGDHSSKFGR
jgi:hypothetical protein